MFKKILIGLAVIIAGILVAAAFQPNTFHVERTVTIATPPEKIIPYLISFHNWAYWDPWAKLDPTMKVTYSGAASGKGAVYEWQGNGQVGQGRMEILDDTLSKISIKLSFLKPMAAEDLATFTLNPKGTSTDVTWA